MGGLLLLALVLGCWLRKRRVRQQTRMRTEARHAERERIARDLHDTLLQGIQGVLLRLQTWVADDGLPSLHRAEIEAVAEKARALVIDARERILCLRRSEIPRDEVISRLRSLAQSGSGVQAPHYAVEVRGRARGLTPEAYETVLEIAGEAVRNAFLHAQAARISLALEYQRRGLSLTVSDDGKGIESLRDDPCCNGGHFGLIGMRERAMQLGGRFAIETNSPHGCRIRLYVPSGLAFARHRKKRPL